MRELSPPRPGEALDVQAVARFLDQHVPDSGCGEVEILQFAAGRSNLTYLLRRGAWEGVLRRPPFGPLPPSAHDMRRECRFLQQLHPVYPLAPRPYALSEDESFLGAPFYVMQRLRGLVCDRVLPPNTLRTAHERQGASRSMVEALVRLHAVEWRATGIAAFARPDGYMRRQVTGWLDRFCRARTDDVPEPGPLGEWLAAHVPERPEATVVHNDFKLNNVLLDPADPTRLAGVLDWEMATVGDPLSDLATLLAYWLEPGEDDFGEMASVSRLPGFLSRAELVELYARGSGRDMAGLPVYEAFARFKVATIYQQIYARWRAGQTADPRFGALGTVVRGMLARAAAAAQL